MKTGVAYNLADTSLLRQRYPTLFEALPNGGIFNRVLDLRFEGCSDLRGAEALHVVAKWVFDSASRTKSPWLIAPSPLADSCKMIS